MAGDGTGALIDGLPRRYSKDAGEHHEGRWRLHVGRAYPRDVVVRDGTCTVGKPSGRPDAEIFAPADVWKQMYDGKLSGIEAFAAGDLNVRGSIEKALRFETMFERPDAGGLEYSIEMVKVGRARVSTLFAGDPSAEPLVLMHGLGATKSSWLTVVPELARRYRVVAVDLPGFGASSKPRARYDAEFLASSMIEFLDVLGYESAMFAGNSMGGRVAMEIAMLEPERAKAIACLCPAAAFSNRPALWLVKLARPELGFFAPRLPRSQIISGLRQLFADPEVLQQGWYEAATDDFLSSWRSPRTRMAFFAAARHIYLDEPLGDAGFWARLRMMQTPSLFIYGAKDALITHRFGGRVQRELPSAEVEVWDDCGHVPQIEHPLMTADRLLGFFGQVSGRRFSAEDVAS
ncbi:MAG: alpha/beta fold hydrolase [Actinobacteria bacterium]|nr:alpha/beta fold hydrolase [Actinomycetota bacterium]